MLMKEYLVNLYNKLKTDSLFLNSVFLMLSTATMSFFGFLFWMLCARIFDPGQIGLATALISVSSLLSSIALLGINTAFIRYIPQSQDRNRDISTGIAFSVLVSVVVVLVFFIIIPLVSPKLVFVRTDPLLASFFLLGVALVTANTLGDNVFIALRAAKYVLMTSAAFSISKLLILLMFRSSSGPAPYFFHIASVAMSWLLFWYLMHSRFVFRFKSLSSEFLRKTANFAMGNYATSLANSLPGLLFPVIVLNGLGEEKAAFYYIAMMMANLLFIIPLSITQSQFAEISHEPEKFKKQLRKTFVFIAALMLPAILLFVFFGRFFLGFFGTVYSSEASVLLSLLSISGLFVGINYFLNNVLRFQARLRTLFLINSTTTLVSITSVFFLLQFGLFGVGIAWIIGEATTSLLLIAFVRLGRIT